MLLSEFRSNSRPSCAAVLAATPSDSSEPDYPTPEVRTHGHLEVYCE